MSTGCCLALTHMDRLAKIATDGINIGICLLAISVSLLQFYTINCHDTMFRFIFLNLAMQNLWLTTEWLVPIDHFLKLFRISVTFQSLIYFCYLFLQGRCPFYLEPAIIICLTDGGKMTTATGASTEVFLTFFMSYFMVSVFICFVTCFDSL